MAVTKIKPIRGTVNKALAYILDPQKTDDAFYVSSYGCAASDAAAKEFEWTRNLAVQQGMQMPKVLARHLIQSFDIGEVTPEEAHEVGKQLADEWLKGKYEYVIATHIDKGHCHNHIIFNAVNYVDFHAYRSNKRTYRELRQLSDEICKEHGLSVIPPSQNKGILKYYKYKDEKFDTRGPYRLQPLATTSMEIIDDRYFWMSCDYDDAVRFRDYVINKETGEKEPNPRSKEQIEPRQQFFACYDCDTHLLYLNDLNRRKFLQQYLSETLQKEFQINNIYTSVDEFCNKIKTIRGFQYTQVDNLFSRGGDLFARIGNMWGQDLPSKIQLKIAYGDIPVHGGGRQIIDIFSRHRNEFDTVVVIGCDDDGVEHTFDFSSVLKHISISPSKDENEHFDPTEVRALLLHELR